MKPTNQEQTSYPEAECCDCGKMVALDERSSHMLEMFKFFRCEDCREIKERERQEALERERIAAERIRQEKLIRRYLQESCIGERFNGMTFDSYTPPNDKAAKVKQACMDYVDNFQGNSGCNILMVGSPGTGKNMLSAIIGQEIIKRYHAPFLHTTALRMVRRVTAAWKSKENEQEVIDSFVEPGLLVIDEVGVQFGTNTEQLYLTEIINDRYEKRKPTILISNLKLSELSELLGARVIDRFYEDGSKFLVFDWPSYRRQ